MSHYKADRGFLHQCDCVTLYIDLRILINIDIFEPESSRLTTWKAQRMSHPVPYHATTHPTIQA